MRSHVYLINKCSECNNSIEVKQIWTPGRYNGYGGWIVECDKSSSIFHVRVGRDINDSQIISGAKIIDRYNDEIGDKEDKFSEYDIC